MTGNKLRLYVAVHPSGIVDNEDLKFHWTFIVGPKVEGSLPVPGIRYHIQSEAGFQWVFYELGIGDTRISRTLLARILIGKIRDPARLAEIMRNAPIVQNNPEWTCRT